MISSKARFDMDSKQIEAAMKEQTPVIYNGVQYRRILEYISRYDHSRKRQLSVVLEPMQGRYTVRVPAEKVMECFSEHRIN